VVQTIWSQVGEMYVQVVDLADVDRSLSLLPPGISEVPESAHFKDQVGLWVDGGLHPAPLGREAVLKLKKSSKRLDLKKKD
jgi:acyl-homoserine lactone acylase PvdQ